MSLLRKWGGSEAAGAQLCRALATAWEQASGASGSSAHGRAGAAAKAGDEDGSGNEIEGDEDAKLAALGKASGDATDEQAAGECDEDDAESVREYVSDLYLDEDDELGERKHGDYEEDSDFWDDDDYASGEDEEE